MGLKYQQHVSRLSRHKNSSVLPETNITCETTPSGILKCDMAVRVSHGVHAIYLPCDDIGLKNITIIFILNYCNPQLQVAKNNLYLYNIDPKTCIYNANLANLILM